MCRRTVCLLSTILLLAVGLGSDSPKEYDDATQMVGLEGSWRLVMIEYQGRRTRQSGAGVTFRRGTYTWTGSPNGPKNGNYIIDPKQKPAQLALTNTDGPMKGRTDKEIYRIDGDTLTMAMFLTKGEERPQSFDVKKDLVLWTFKRLKN
jgi:uncharacterized protein (TIGR03067 family)